MRSVLHYLPGLVRYDFSVCITDRYMVLYVLLRPH